MNTKNDIFHLRHSIIWNPYIFHTPPPKYQKGQNTQVLRLLESLGPVTTNTAWKAQKVTLYNDLKSFATNFYHSC